jgi:pyruvate kinase
MSAMYAANHLNGVQAIIALTESGHTAKLMSRITTALPIFALSRHPATLAKMALYRGVYPLYFDTRESELKDLVQNAIHEVEHQGHLHKGDFVIVTYGDLMGTIGSSNTVKIMQV